MVCVRAALRTWFHCHCVSGEVHSCFLGPSTAPSRVQTDVEPERRPALANCVSPSDQGRVPGTATTYWTPAHMHTDTHLHAHRHTQTHIHTQTHTLLWFNPTILRWILPRLQMRTFSDEHFVPGIHATVLCGKALLFLILMDKRRVFLWIPYDFKAKGGKMLSPSVHFTSFTSSGLCFTLF